MKTTIADFSKAYSIMYGPTTETPAALLKRLNSQDLKKTFRHKAMECHPDRATINHIDSAKLDNNFKDINWAYQVLKEALSDSSALFAAPAQPVYAGPAAYTPPPAYSYGYGYGYGYGYNYAHSTSAQEAYNSYSQSKAADDHFWCGTMPKQRLPFGQFLYYSGKISWNTLLEALDWQENQRPKFGQIALEGQLLSPGALSRLLSHRYRGEKIGDAAMRLGYLSPRMKEAVLNIQKHRQPALGQYFLSRGLLSQDELGRCLLQQRQHNNMAG